MSLRRFAALAACATLGATACLHAPTTDDPASTALVYGHIEPAPGRTLQAVELAQAMSPRHTPGRVFANGDFVFAGIRPGQYMLFRFMAGGEWYDLTSRDKEQNKQFIFRVVAGEMHYAGSFRVTGETHKVVSLHPDTFGIARSDRPTSAEIRHNLRQQLAGTHWGARVESGR